MLDQSFSVKNFLKIFYSENRKGNYTEKLFFPELVVISKQLLIINQEVKEKKKLLKNNKIKNDEFQKFIKDKISQKKILQEEKLKKLEGSITLIKNNIVNNNFLLKLNNNFEIAGKKVYTLKKSPELFFLSKQIQKNIRRTFKVKQSDRNEIINQIINIVDNDFPKYIIRTDIKSFYESIPHNELKEMLNKNQSLSIFSLKIIKRILNEYKTLTNNDKGVPRGIGISAYLSELYMRDIDNEIKNIEDVIYYARYVDDIIIIFTPKLISQNISYLDMIKNIIENKNKLTLNINKTDEYKYLNSSDILKFEFLGYKIIYNKEIKVGLSKNKRIKYKKRIDLLIDTYNLYSKYNEKKERKLLVNRIRFLTENARLLNVKKHILIGIYFTNKLLTNLFDLKVLDRYLRIKIKYSLKITGNVNQINLIKRLSKFSFEHGFINKTFSKFTRIELENILKIWKN